MSSATPPSPPEHILIDTTPDAPRQTHHVRLAVGTVAGLALAGVLAWAVWWWFFCPTVYVVGLPPVGYGPLVVPPLRFAAEDVDALAGPGRSARTAVLSGLNTSQRISQLGDRLASLAAKEKDTLILYARVYGVSDNGQAKLLWGDYLQAAEGGRTTPADLFGQLAKCKAGKKLLLLDTGDLAYDPRLGVFVNEFPLLLEDEIRRVDDPRLWILVSNRPLEVSHMIESEGRSVFSHFITRGLAGAADRNGDGVVDLAELVSFVRGGVSAWVADETGGVQSQTPWLRNGKGAVRAPAGFDLLSVAAARGAARPSAAVRKRPADTARCQSLLDEAWRLRDRGQQRTAAAPWTPVDYAPHLWRAWQELLLGYERRCYSGAQFDPAQLAADLQANILPLAALLDGAPLPPAVGKTSLLGRLADARERFLANAKKEQLDRLAREKRSGRYLELVRLKNDLVFRGRDYVRWHAAASRASAERLRLYQPIYDYLAALKQFVDQLEVLEGAAPTAKAYQVDQGLSSAELLVQSLQPLTREIEEEGLYKEAAALIDQAEKNPAKRGIAGPIGNLLATPLLPAPLRAKLLEARSRLKQSPAADDQAARGTPSQLLVPWSGRLYDQATFEEQLVALAEPAAQFPPLQSTEVVSVRTLLAQYRWLGKALWQFYSQQLPSGINQGFQARDPAVVRRCERWLRSIDARDAEQIRPEVAGMAVRAVRFPSAAPALPGQPKPPPPAKRTKPK